MLTKINKSDLKIYRRYYEVDFPKYIVTLGLFDHFIDRFQKYPEWEEKVQFLRLEESQFKDGTFVFINGPHIYFDSFEAAPHQKLSLLLTQLDYSQEKVFIGVRDAFRPLLKDLLRIHHLEKTFDTGTRCVWWSYDLTPEEVTKWTEFFIKQIPEGFHHGSLKEEHAESINSVWAQKHTGSIEFLKSAITMNPCTGIYTNDGELVAWMMFFETGALSNLQVKEEYRRKDIARLLSALQYFKLKKLDRLAFGHVVHHNNASFNLAINKQKGKWVGNNTWMGFKKKSKPEFSPLWGNL